MPESISLAVNGVRVDVAEGAVISAALAVAGIHAGRLSVTGEPRGPLCGMGICFECRVTIDGHTHRRACQTVCRPGMQVLTDGFKDV